MPLKGSKNSYITVANVEWLQKAGLTVVPISVNTPIKEVKELCKGVSGFYFQGGPDYDRRYMRLIATLLRYAATHRVPVWGTCHGFQMLIVMIGGLWPLESMENMIQKRAVLKEEETGDSLLYNAATRMEKAHLHKPGGVPFSHEYGITLKTFLSSRILRTVFKPLTITKDGDGTEYVSSIEGIHLPFWGVQYHPELDSHLNWMATFFKNQMKPSEPIGKHLSLPKKATMCPDAWQEGPVKCYEFRE